MGPAHALAALPATEVRAQRGAVPQPTEPQPLGSGLLRQALAGPGDRLEAGRRLRVERATGTDLSDVRLHTGARARVAARALRAAAFTVGDDVVVASAPGGAVPQRLLDHELTHVAQHRNGRESSAADAERQAAEVADHPLADVDLVAPAGRPAAFAPEDWLTGSPDISAWGLSALLDEQRDLAEWLDRQVAGSQETDQIQEAKSQVEAVIAQRRALVAQAERPVSRRRRGPRQPAPGVRPSSTPTADLPPQSEMPRVLRDRSSAQLSDPAEMRAEVDRIARWLERPDLGRDDRTVLHAELQALAPALGADLDLASAQRQQARLTRTFTPSDPEDHASLVANLRVIDSIAPYSARPGMAYVLHEGESLVFPEELANRVRAQAREALATAGHRASDLNESTEYRMSEHMRLNYDESPVIGFFVSVVSGEEPVDLQRRMLGPLSDSNIALSRYRTAARSGSLADMGDAVLTAIEKAADAQQIVLDGIDRSIAAAGQIVQGLEITRDLSFAIALSIGAILAAPVVAAGVAGAGVTGVTATVFTAGGTGLVVGSEGTLLGFTSGAGGELAAGHGAGAALRTGLSEGGRVGAQGLETGLGAGFGLGFTRNLGLGAEGMTRAGTLWRSALAQGGAGALGSGLGGLVRPPEGMGRGEGALRGGLTGLGFGLLGGTAGAFAEGISSPVGRFALGTGLPSLAGGGLSYLQTGDWHQAVINTSMGLAVGAAATRAPNEPTSAQRRAFGLGESIRARVGGPSPGSWPTPLSGGLLEGGGPPDGSSGRSERRVWVHPEDADQGHFHPMPDDVAVEHGRGSGRSEGETLTSYAEVMRSRARENPATAAVRGGQGEGPYIRDNLYSGTGMRRAVGRLQEHGILQVSADGATVQILRPEPYVQWLERAYRQQGQAHLDPRMREAILGYVGHGEPLGAGTNPHTGGSSFGGALPGTHAELLAVNDLLAGGGAADPAHVATVRAKTGAHFVACVHCAGILGQLPPAVRAILWTGQATRVP